MNAKNEPKVMIRLQVNIKLSVMIVTLLEKTKRKNHKLSNQQLSLTQFQLIFNHLCYSQLISLLFCPKDPTNPNGINHTYQQTIFLYYFRQKLATANIIQYQWNQLMNKSKQIQEEYSNLKNKVEGRIKQLQSKLIPLPSPNKMRGPLLQMPNSPHHHHPCHHHCHGNYCHSSQQPTPVQFSVSHIEPLASQVNSLKQINIKNNSTNELLSEAIAESLKNQRQINEHIKAINEKIENISVQHNRSNLSQAFSESVRKPKNVQRLRREVILSEEKFRCHSQINGQEQNDDPNKTQTKRYKVEPKKIRSKLKSNASSSKLLEGSSRKGQSKSKSKAKIVSEYFLSFGCPVHSPNKISLKSIRRKEVYKDSQHRNRKHEKNHLLQSFRQQERSRKRLISKISQNAFSEYGKK